MGSKDSKSPKNEVFRVVAKIVSTQIYMFFYFNTKVSMDFKIFVKTRYLVKVWFLSYGPKMSRPIRMHDFLN